MTVSPVGNVTTIRVATRPGYDVVVGYGLDDAVAAAVGGNARQVAVAHAAGVGGVAARLQSSLESAGLIARLLPIPDGEQAKTTAIVDGLWDAFGDAGMTRSDVIVAVGGGAATDLVGFAAATFLRGINVVHVPTTLLAMVDAAVGGKTGINSAAGKNLVGSFHQPAGVVCDLDTLRSLPRPEMVSGLAEVVKCGFIADPEILRLVESDPRAATDAASPVVRALVERAVTVKAAVVAGDEREATSRGSDVGREVLNYGHTLGHAIERVEQFQVRHGEAVAAGMVYVAELARLAGRLDAVVVARHRDVLRSVGLPVTYEPDRWPDLLSAMRVDKKSRGTMLRFVVLDDIARPAILEAPDEALLEAAYAAISQRP
jgi:3-dehydroquinate synthase